MPWHTKGFESVGLEDHVEVLLCGSQNDRVGCQTDKYRDLAFRIAFGARVMVAFGWFFTIERLFVLLVTRVGLYRRAAVGLILAIPHLIQS